MGAYADRVRATRPAARLPEHARGFLFTALAAAVAAGATSSIASHGHVRWRDFAIVLVAGTLAQLFATHTAGNQVFHTGLVFTVAAALLLPPQLVVVVAVAQHLPEWGRQRYPWFIQSFNIANFVLSGLVAWGVRDELGSGVGAFACAGATFVVVNHLLLARMLRVARGHKLAVTGLFSVEGLLTDAVLAGIGVAVAYALVHAPALAPVVALPLLLIHRAVALATLREQPNRDQRSGSLSEG